MKIRQTKKILQLDCDGAAYRFGTLVRARRRYRSWKWNRFSADFPVALAWRGYADYQVWQQAVLEELCRGMGIRGRGILTHKAAAMAITGRRNVRRLPGWRGSSADNLTDSGH